MKNFFHSTGFKILLAAVVILLGLLIYTQQVGSSLLANVINLFTSPMQSVSTSAKESLSDTLEPLGDDPEALKAQIAALEEENRSYREQLVDYYDCQRKVVQYESILDVKAQNDDFKLISASVIGRDPNDLFYSFSIDLGSLDGISLYDPVITGDGLVGWVSQVYATSAKVTTIFSEDTQIGAAAKQHRENGVLGCELPLADQGVVKLSLLDQQTKVSTGDIITTTGLSGRFPKNLLIGKVTEVREAEYDISKYALITPYVDIKNVMDVFVITDFNGKGEISAVSQDSGSDPASDTASSQEPEGS